MLSSVHLLRRNWRILLFFFIASLVICGALLARWLGPLPDVGHLSERVAPPSSLILDRSGRLLYEVTDPAFGKHTPLPLARLPVACQQATIATEDAHFYTHPGVDLWAVARALRQDIRSGAPVAGGSTLTQQLARNLLLSQEERGLRTLRRKLREAWLALQLERRYDKDALLALYLNETYYGHFAYGIEAAAQSYFGKHVAELDLAECTLLAGLPQSPVAYNPIENPQAARRRQEIVLGLMVKAGFISQEEADLAAREQLRFASTPFPIQAPHFVMLVQQVLERELEPERLRQGGLRIYTTLDLDWQQAADETIRYRLLQLVEDRDAPIGRRIDNAALVALDPHTGDILAMVGSPDYFDQGISGAVNGALALRQPGSAIKPITYAAAFDPERAARHGEEPLTPATVLADVRAVFSTKEGTSYIPQNYDLVEHGPVAARQALASSLNIPAVKVLQHVGLPDFIEQARRLGITAFDDPDRYGLALTLGGGEVRLLDLTAAYAAFANGGRRVVPQAILRVEDQEGAVLWAWTPEMGDQAVSPQIAYLVTHILSDNRARSLGFGVNSPLRLDRPAAVKTGTTTDWRDNWTVGYTPDLAAGVWVGNADNAPMAGVSGVDGAAPIWRDFMLSVMRHQEPNSFPRPQDLVEVEVCADSGLLPDAFCPRRQEWFIAGTEPVVRDQSHHLIEIDAATGLLATEGTPRERVVQRIARTLPVELHDWARQRGILLESDLNQQTDVGGGGLAMLPPSLEEPLVIDSPANHTTYRLDPSLSQSAQQIEVVARTGDSVHLPKLQIWVDGVQLTEWNVPPYRTWWTLVSGTHEFRAVGMDSNGRVVVSPSVRIFVEGLE